MEPIQYKGFTIKEDWLNPYSKTPHYMYFPTEEGECHDADYRNDSMVYDGNCKWADSLELAIEEIDELLTETI